MAARIDKNRMPRKFVTTTVAKASANATSARNPTTSWKNAESPKFSPPLMTLNAIKRMPDPPKVMPFFRLI